MAKERCILPIPENFQPESMRLFYGNLAVELVLFAKGKVSQLSGGPIAVASKMASGHLLAVWGYDEEQKVFFCFDTSKGARRDKSGLTPYSYDELLRVWGKYAWLTFLVSKVSRFLPRWQERLRCKPFMAVIA